MCEVARRQGREPLVRSSPAPADGRTPQSRDSRRGSAFLQDEERRPETPLADQLPPGSRCSHFLLGPPPFRARAELGDARFCRMRRTAQGLAEQIVDLALEDDANVDAATLQTIHEDA